MIVLKWANLGLRFILELCGLLAIGYWGFHTGKTLITKSLLGIGTPLLVAVVWGMFISPQAPYQLSNPLRILLELAIFGSATAALFSTGQSKIAITFAISVVVNSTLMIIWKQ
ncbi:YrdB family protein [Bacillus sp. CGMCC 1.16607]|uniref:YrdB family protein n=1 Tax=Bacillus sp. CGMCC 1.16607 TaxID=3351842 RepID=UPI003637C0D4